MIAFIPLDESALSQVLAWRTNPLISRYLFTDIDDDLEKQKKWFERASRDQTSRYWLIRCQKQNVGLAYLSAIDLMNRSCSCGYYIGEKKFNRIGGMILPGIVNSVFETLNFNKIYGEVLAGNDNVLKLHEFHGYRQVGIWQQHIFKYGEFHDVYLFELLRGRWQEMKHHYRQFCIPVIEEGA